jgi:glycerol uptake facilitator-like aquaporin
MLSRKQMTAYVAEFFGTALLTFSILAVSRSAIGVPYFIAIGVGLTLGLLVMMIGSVSGAHVNPAVTIGMWTIRKIKSLDAILYVAAQFIGAVAAFKLYEYLVVQGVQSIAPAEFDWRTLVAEATGAFVFTFGIAAAVYQKYEGGKLAATIGGSLFLGILVAGVASNGILNPAAALGVQSWSRAYVAGPIIGAIVGMNLYILLFAPESSLKALVGGSTKKKSTKKPAKKKK